MAQRIRNCGLEDGTCRKINVGQDIAECVATSICLNLRGNPIVEIAIRVVFGNYAAGVGDLAEVISAVVTVACDTPGGIDKAREQSLGVVCVTNDTSGWISY